MSRSEPNLRRGRQSWQRRMHGQEGQPKVHACTCKASALALGPKCAIFQSHVLRGGIGQPAAPQRAILPSSLPPAIKSPCRRIFPPLPSPPPPKSPHSTEPLPACAPHGRRPPLPPRPRQWQPGLRGAGRAGRGGAGHTAAAHAGARCSAGSVPRCIPTAQQPFSDTNEFGVTSPSLIPNCPALACPALSLTGSKCPALDGFTTAPTLGASLGTADCRWAPPQPLATLPLRPTTPGGHQHPHGVPRRVLPPQGRCGRVRGGTAAHSAQRHGAAAPAHERAGDGRHTHTEDGACWGHGGRGGAQRT